MLHSNHSKRDDGQGSTGSVSRSHITHGQQLPAAVAAADAKLTPPAGSTSLRGVVDAAVVSVAPGTELGERHGLRRDSRRPSNVGKSAFEFSFWNRASGSRVTGSAILGGSVGSRVSVFDPVLSFNMLVYRGVVSTISAN